MNPKPTGNNPFFVFLKNPWNLLALGLISLGFVLRGIGWWGVPECGDVQQMHGHALLGMQGRNVYQETLFPYFPGWFWTVTQTFRFSEWMGYPFNRVIRGLFVGVDALICLLLWIHASRSSRPGRGRWVAVAYALSPMAILISAYHGQFDALAMLFILIAITWVHLEKYPFWFGCFLGLSTLIKPPSALAVGASFLARGLTWAERWRLVLAWSLVMILGCSWFLWQDAGSLIRSILTYAGVTDQGFGGLLRSLWFWRSGNMYLPGDFAERFSQATRNLTLVMMALAFVLVRQRGLAASAAAIYLVFLSCFGAVSTQYLMWPLVWLLIADAPLWLVYVYGFGVTCGALGFYATYWPTFIFLPNVDVLQSPFIPWFVAGEFLSYATILFTTWRWLKLSVNSFNWKNPWIAGLLVLGAVAFYKPATMLGWIAREWLALPPM